MEPSKDAVSVRIGRLNAQLMNKSQNSKEKINNLKRETLLDALQVLYDECNSDYLKNGDKNVLAFVDRFRRTLMEMRQIRVNLSDFEVKNVVGRGHFGEVHLVKEKQTGDVYAMKTVRKFEHTEQKSVAYEEERNIMASACSHWITKLQYAFQDSTNLYYIMEYHPGGDLLGLLNRQGGTLPESATTFYIAELVVAINYLHEMGYVHRDIKPDNVLLDRCGHLKLADFGSAAKVNNKGTISGGIPVGTPDYIAPEALQSFDNKSPKVSGSYGKSCDYWSLGILAYELTVGTTPFSGQNTTATYSKIINHTKTLKFPPDILLTQAFITFIKGLLCDEATRFTYIQIINHQLFKNVDFTGLRDQVPPYVPKIQSHDDTSNFCDIQVKKKQPSIENFKSKTQFSGRNLPFIGFTYVTEPPDYKESYRASIATNSELVDTLKNEIKVLQKSMLKISDIDQEKEAIERKYEEKHRKLESVERVRDNLEKDLADNIAECQALKRTLDLERKERTELERKALEIIKSAKLKWEATEKIKIDNMNQLLEESRHKNSDLVIEIERLNSQLKNALDVTNKHKASLESVEKLRRSSVIGLESRLEKVTTDTQNKVANLQVQLANDNQKRLILENKITNLEQIENDITNKLILSEKNAHELKSKCAEQETVIAKLKDDIKDVDNLYEELDLYKSVISKLEDDLEMARNDATKDNELAKQAETNFVLKKQVKDLKTELNSMRSSKLNTLDELKTKHEANVKDLEQQLKTMREEKDDACLKVKEVEETLKSRESKVNTLQELLSKLQADLAKLETGSERECVLQEQIERLEQQIIEVSETNALEKQEHNQLKAKFWRMQKDLTNADLDRKIVERDLKDEMDKNKELHKEIESLKENATNIKKSFEESISEMGRLNDELDHEVTKLKEEIKSLKQKLDGEKNLRSDYEKEITDFGKTIEKKELQICNVLKMLDESKLEKLEYNVKLQENVRELQCVNKQFDEKCKECNNLQNEFDKLTAELENSHLNRKALREACAVLDKQLTEFETIYDCLEIKKNELQTEVGELKMSQGKLKDEIQEAKKLMNEEKSLKLLAETKCRRLTDDLEHLQKELDCYKLECEESKEYSNDIREKLIVAEQKLSNNDSVIKNMERQIEDYHTDCNFLKEELSEQLTFIGSLKESNYKLGHNLSDCKMELNTAISKCNELEDILNEKIHFFKERELKYEGTIQQQTKLIDFLQSKVEESNKKKKTLSDKLFGHSKKENVAPLSVVFNYKDLEFQLQKEKEENKKLTQEILKFKQGQYKAAEGTLKRDTLKNIHLQDEVLSQIVQSPSSQKNDLYRQNSVQRMHHNIPHRFESKIFTKPSKCAQCSNQILIGRNTHVCSECHITAHVTCSNSLPRTCGLPTAFVKHYSDSLLKIKPDSKSSPSKMSIEKANIEGWVKVPMGGNWEKYYACLTSTTLTIYPEPPNNPSIEAVQSLKIDEQNEHGKVVLEPLSSEIDIPVANSDLPFVIKVESVHNSACWPSQCIIFMTLSIEDKDKWFNALYSVFHSGEKYTGDVILSNIGDLEINCLYEIDSLTKLLGTDNGLYSLSKNSLLQIGGLSRVKEIEIIPSISTVLMIADENRSLISCDLKHLLSLTQSASCVKPTLKFKSVNVNNLKGFHMMKASNFVRNKNICLSTDKQVIILRYDTVKKEFIPQRILDTAEPVSCVLFTEHSLIIGADKFFEVDLSTFTADEFLDVSDQKLSNAVECYNLRSFPLAILQISKPPSVIEFLLCYHEFSTFVDEFGRSTRLSDISWKHLPTAFFFSYSYLYVVQFNSVEIFKITDKVCNTTEGNDLQSFKLEVSNVRYLGCNASGIFILADKQVRFLNACILDDDASSIVTSNADQVESESQSDRFSFTSSMMQSLDGQLSDVESEQMEEKDFTSAGKKVTFVQMTNL